ncbi:MAG TPA: hypothetical protein PLQ04_00330 [Lachnospiraceae bacterium]|nr:hypothetical protein [Lachnospiraceae bacterium]
MGKGRYGISFVAYAAIAFALAILGMRTLLILFIIFLLVAEKNEWASRQAIQALIYSLLAKGFDVAMTWRVRPFITFNMEHGFFSGLTDLYMGSYGWLRGIVAFAVIVFLAIGLIRVCQGKEAKLPLADQLAHWFFKSMPSDQQSKPAE